jgi:hypothetical protein
MVAGLRLQNTGNFVKNYMASKKLSNSYEMLVRTEAQKTSIAIEYKAADPTGFPCAPFFATVGRQREVTENLPRH